MFGLEHPDQPVLAGERVRFWGEPVAVVAAEDAATARRRRRPSKSDMSLSRPSPIPRRQIVRDEIFRRIFASVGAIRRRRASVVVEG